MQQSWESLPKHLERYVVEQDYSRYTPENQAVWRFIMRGLKDHLSVHAHPCYLEGLEKSGISTERIPKISEMDLKLRQYGWGAVPVSGFIPPAAFMEFQSMGLLPIASDMRTLDHLLYTPAPDIVHEAAGHAPILIDPEFAGYLKHYGEVARHAIISRWDLDQYEAIRELSDIKEHPDSTEEQIKAATERLNHINGQIKEVSEAGLLSRMNWWTAEYGLIGDVNSPRIFGAGLLSSLGEARSCLEPEVKKIPLTVDCVDYAYDITEKQPQLFVTPDFASLYNVLDELAERMAFRRGGVFGLQQALIARTVNTVKLDSGLEISGQLVEYTTDSSGSPEPKIEFVRFSGPCQLSFERTQIPEQGTQHHPHGFSSPLGPIMGFNKSLSLASGLELSQLGFRENETLNLEFRSGIQVQGRLKKLLFERNKLLLISLVECQVSRGNQILFCPEWGAFDMAVGEKIISVFGGPADREHYDLEKDFTQAQVPAKRFSPGVLEQHQILSRIRQFRETGDPTQAQQFLTQASEEFLKNYKNHWLMGLEILELCDLHGLKDIKSAVQETLSHLEGSLDGEIYQPLDQRRPR